MLSDVLVVVQPDGGRMEVSLGRDEQAVVPGSLVLLPAHQVVSVLWADTVADCVSVPIAEVERLWRRYLREEIPRTSGIDEALSPPPEFH